MYRKSMRSALEEARAYSAVNEVKVSKGGKTLDISKKDVGVYQAKGWSLQEANMKRILQALQDKLSDEGGAAGFDDLKKTAKSMGLDLTPAMLKDMPGIKQHRDGDYILETIEEGISISNARKEIQKIYDTAKKAGILGTTGHDNFKELLKQTDRKKLYRDMHKVGSSFGTVGKSNFSTPGISGSVGDKIGKQLVDLSYKVNEEIELEEAIGMTGGSRMLEYFVKYRMGPGDKFNTQGPFNLRDAVKFKRSVESKGGQAQVTQNPFEEKDLEEQKKYMLTYGKKGEKVKAFYSDDHSDVQKKASELRGKGFVVDKMGLTQPMSKLRDRIPEEINTDTYADSKKKMLNKEGTELVEFTLADYRELESDNQHDIAAKKLIDKFGTSQEKSTINDINRRHAKTGYISGTDFRLRTMIVNRYYSRLK